MSTSADSFLQRVWYDGKAPWLSLLLLPLSWLFRAIVCGRRLAYRSGILHTIRVDRPVIVIGNITAGGTGKTPLTIWLAAQLRARGLRVGIILRGYGGRSTAWPCDVTSDTPWESVGDEAVLLANRTGGIVVAGADRVADAQRAIERGAQVVLSDDGLQHYRLARDCEIAVIDAHRGGGNGRMLPAGPLREPPARLCAVSLRVLTQRSTTAAGIATALGKACPAVTVVARMIEAVSIATGERRSLQSFSGARVHAVAGIGHPEAFFDALSALNMEVRAHPLPDHARLTAADISFPDDDPVLMTEKDAVKCRSIAGPRHWVVRMDVEMNAGDAAVVAAMLDRLLGTGCT